MAHQAEMRGYDDVYDPLSGTGVEGPATGGFDMRKSMVLAAAIGIGMLAVGVAGCASEPASQPACECAKGKAGESTWCFACRKGYDKGRTTECANCYETMLAGGGKCSACAAK